MYVRNDLAGTPESSRSRRAGRSAVGEDPRGGRLAGRPLHPRVAHAIPLGRHPGDGWDDRHRRRPGRPRHRLRALEFPGHGRQGRAGLHLQSERLILKHDELASAGEWPGRPGTVRVLAEEDRGRRLAGLPAPRPSGTPPPAPRHQRRPAGRPERGRGEEVRYRTSLTGPRLALEGLECQRFESEYGRTPGGEPGVLAGRVTPVAGSKLPLDLLPQQAEALARVSSGST